MVAARSGSVRVVNVLLEAGADVNQRDADGATALTEAATAGLVAVVKVP